MACSPSCTSCHSSLWSSQVKNLSVVKNLPANLGDAGDWGLIPALGRSTGGGYGILLQYSYIPVFLPGKPHRQRSLVATVHGGAKSWTRLRDWAHSIKTCCPVGRVHVTTPLMRIFNFRLSLDNLIGVGINIPCLLRHFKCIRVGCLCSSGASALLKRTSRPRSVPISSWIWNKKMCEAESGLTESKRSC